MGIEFLGCHTLKRAIEYISAVSLYMPFFGFGVMRCLVVVIAVDLMECFLFLFERKLIICLGVFSIYLNFIFGSFALNLLFTKQQQQKIHKKKIK